MPVKDQEKRRACSKRYYEANRERILKRASVYYRGNKEEIQSYQEEYRNTHQDNRDCKPKNVLARHNLTVEQYDSRREKQRQAGDLCGVCKKPLVENPKPNLDHDHVTGELRDFLHAGCNMALGLLKDDPITCRLAAEYLERHKESTRCTPLKQDKNLAALL